MYGLPLTVNVSGIAALHGWNRKKMIRKDPFFPRAARVREVERSRCAYSACRVYPGGGMIPASLWMVAVPGVLLASTPEPMISALSCADFLYHFHRLIAYRHHHKLADLLALRNPLDGRPVVVQLYHDTSRIAFIH